MRALVAAVLVLALGACGSGGGKKTASPTTTVTTAPETTVAAGAPKQAAPGAVTTPAAATSTTSPQPDVALTSFKTPSSNVGCQVDASNTRCDIREHTWAPPPKPATCDLDWGSGIEISGGDVAQFVCAGDTAFDPSAPVLAYGQRTRQGSIVCESATAGVTCTNEASHHGFFLSRDSYRIF